MMLPVLAAFALVAQTPDQITSQLRTGKLDWQAVAKNLRASDPGQEGPCSNNIKPCYVERVELAQPAHQVILVVFDEHDRQAYLSFMQARLTGVYFAAARTRRPGYRIDNGFLRVPSLGVRGSDWNSEPEAWLELGNAPFRPVLSINRTARENANGFGITTDIMSHAEPVNGNEIQQRVHIEMSLLGHLLGSRTYWATYVRTRAGDPFQLRSVSLDRQGKVTVSRAEFQMLTEISVDEVPGRQKRLVKLVATQLRALAQREPDLRDTIAEIVARQK